jgi:hypothetical protein
MSARNLSAICVENSHVGRKPHRRDVLVDLIGCEVLASDMRVPSDARQIHTRVRDRVVCPTSMSEAENHFCSSPLQ